MDRHNVTIPYFDPPNWYNPSSIKTWHTVMSESYGFAKPSNMEKPVNPLTASVDGEGTVNITLIATANGPNSLNLKTFKVGCKTVEISQETLLAMAKITAPIRQIACVLHSSRIENSGDDLPASGGLLINVDYEHWRDSREFRSGKDYIRLNSAGEYAGTGSMKFLKSISIGE